MPSPASPNRTTISVTGLQSAPDECSPKRLDRPIRFLVELEAPVRWNEDVELELLVEAADAPDQTALRFTGMVHPGPGLCWAEATIAAHRLQPGRYHLVARVPGHDLFRSRHLMDVWRPAADVEPVDAADPGPEEVLTPTDRWRAHPGPMPRATGLYHVEQVRIQRADGSEPVRFRGDEPVRVVTRLRLEDVQAPLLRLQFFSLSGELLVGTNNARWEIDLGPGSRRVVTVDLDRLNLTPGRYLATVGLWPSEGDPCVLEARHAFHEIVIGDEHGGAAMVRTHESWRRPTEQERAGAGPTPVLLQPLGRLEPGQDLCLDVLVPPGEQVRIWLESEQQRLGALCAPRLVAAEPMVLHWCVFLAVPPGEYRLCFGGSEVEAGQLPLRVPPLPAAEGRWSSAGGR